MKYTSLVNGLLLIILFFLVYLALFHNLGVLPIARWDEGLFAMRAYYLAENGHLLANFNEFPGMGDYHNLKPPLGTLIQAFSFQLFGYNSWALRFPIVLSTCLLLVVLTFQLKKVEGSWWPGILSTLILISSTGLIHTHVAKSGDHDVFYLLFMLLQVFSFFQITIETQTKQKDRTIILFFLSLLSAFLIKEIMAFFLLPAFLIFAIYSKTFIPLLTSKRMLLYGGVFVLLIVGYFFGMNLLIPDFLSHTVEEVWNRYSTSIEGHSLPWYYYLVQFGSDRFFPWIILSPLVFYDLATTPKNQLFSFKILLWTCLIWFFIVISYSATKMSWYAALTYPFGAMLLGLSFKHLISKVSSQIKLLLLTLFIGVFSFSFYQNIYQKVHQKVHQKIWEPNSDQFGHVFLHLKESDSEDKSYTVYSYEFNGQIGFYTKWLMDYHNFQFDCINFWGQIPHHLGEKVIVCHNEKRANVNKDYETVVIEQINECEILELTRKLE